jgi:hypothetical protein
LIFLYGGRTDQNISITTYIMERPGLVNHNDERSPEMSIKEVQAWFGKDSKKVSAAEIKALTPEDREELRKLLEELYRSR